MDKIITKEDKISPDRSYILDNRSLFSPNEYETLIAISKGVFLEKNDNPFFTSKEINTRSVSIETTIDHLDKISRLHSKEDVINGLNSLSRLHFTHKEFSDDLFIVCYKSISNLEIKNDGKVVFDIPTPMYIDVIEISIFLTKQFF